MSPIKTPFVLAAVQGGTMILNCLDCSPEDQVDGPGADMLRDGFRDPGLTALVIRMAESRRKSHGNGVTVIDGGAHVGSFTVPWARHMRGWGRVIAFEPQRWIHMALCGNVVLNNCFNVEARREALGGAPGSVLIPCNDPSIPLNSGGVQAGSGSDRVPLMAIDALDLDRCDAMKLDLEGMEPQALEGAAATIRRHKPLIIAEHFICDASKIIAALPDYNCIGLGADLLCVHKDEPNLRFHADMADLAQHLNYRTVT